MNQKVLCLNSFSLKLIAIITMAVDHIGAVLFPGEMIFRIIGRIGFPVFIFLMVEGFYHTGNLRKYEIRMILFAFISEIPFDLAFSDTMFDWSSQNVFFTLAIGLIMLDLLQTFQGCHWKQACVFIACVAGAVLLSTDYSGGGILLIYSFYWLREKPVARIIAVGVISLFCFGLLECFCLLAFVPILLYNGKRGPSLKYAVYVFYPAHLFVLFLISLVMQAGDPFIFGGVFH